MSKFSLKTPIEFSFERNCEFLLRSPREMLHRVENGFVYKLIKVDDEKVLFRLKEGKGKITIELLTGSSSKDIKQVVTQYVREWFDLETDLQPFYNMASKDKMLGPLVKKYYGYRIIGQPDLFESIVWAVLGQQINLTFAYTLKQRFVEHFGERLQWNGNHYYLFPTPRVVAGLRDEMLLPLQFSRQKSQYTINIGNVFSQGHLSKEKLKGLSFEESKDMLMQIKGIGNWTANYALMKTFRYPNAFPLEDAGIHNAIKNLKKMERKPTLEEVKRIFRKYKGWEAYATLYLWKSL